LSGSELEQPKLTEAEMGALVVAPLPQVAQLRFFADN
jgi:hypothetical protein